MIMSYVQRFLSALCEDADSLLWATSYSQRFTITAAADIMGVSGLLSMINKIPLNIGH